MAKTANRKTLVDRKKAHALFRRLEQQGLGDAFKGMTEDQIVRAIKRTRETIWQKKLAVGLVPAAKTFSKAEPRKLLALKKEPGGKTFASLKALLRDLNSP